MIQIHSGSDTNLNQHVPACAQIYVRVEIACGGSLDCGERSVMIGNSHNLDTGALDEALLNLLVLIGNRINPEDDIALLHYLLDSVQSVCALQEVRFAAGNLIGLKGKFLGNAVVVTGKVYCLGLLYPLYNLGGNLKCQSLLNLCGQSCQTGLNVLACNVPKN